MTIQQEEQLEIEIWVDDLWTKRMMMSEKEYNKAIVDKFASQRKQVYEQAYQDVSKRFRLREETLRKLTKEELIEEIKKLKEPENLIEVCNEFSVNLDEKICFDDGYNQAITDIVEALRKI